MKVCSIEDCSHRVVGWGWCNAHYRRWLKHGDPHAWRLPVRGVCSIDGCDRPHRARGWCNRHYQRWATYGDATREPLYMAARLGQLHPQWKGDEATYFSVHDRHRDTLGLARDQPCRHCGKQAAHWAYDHGDPAELRDKKTGLIYSTDPTHYIPLCVPCHSRFDKQAAERLTQDLLGHASPSTTALYTGWAPERAAAAVAALDETRSTA